MLLSIEFEKPKPEIMESWNKWFDHVKDRIVDQGSLMSGEEILKEGTKDLPRDL